MNYKKHFKKLYWGDKQETEVEFQLNDKLPPTELITTCFVIPYYNDKLILTKFTGGFKFPGGHREENESAEDCLRRESLEESSIVLGKPKLVGRWVATKRFTTDYNRAYPDVAYQLQYISEVKELRDFKKSKEFLDRKLIDKKELRDYFQNYEKYSEVFDYLIENYIVIK